MAEIIYNKLVRDKIPDIIRKGGKEPVTRVLEGDEFLQYLDRKLLEEVQEYLEAPSREEIADILEVLEAILAVRRIPQAELRRTKNAKALKNGSFRERYLLEKVIDPGQTDPLNPSPTDPTQ